VPKHSELLDRTSELGHRLTQRMRRRLDEARAHWRAAVRGLPRPEELVALPRQRFDAAEKRLARALMASTQAHAKRFAHVSPRLQPRLLAIRIEREEARLERFGARAVEALSRIAAGRRLRLARVAGRLSPVGLTQRLSRSAERIEEQDRRRLSAFGALLTRYRQRLTAQGQMLASLSYHSVLGRGFALVRDSKGRTVRSVAALTAGAHIDIEVADGHAGAVITPAAPSAEAGGAEVATSVQRTTPTQGPSDVRPRPPRGRPGASGRGPGGQGSLF
jgi:exodeoxyribonuclease VII large subunit